MELTLQILTALATLMLTGLGLTSMFAPQKMLKNFALEPIGAPGYSTIRSVIGGLFLASVGFLALAIFAGQHLGYLAVALVMALVALGRIISMVADGFDKAVVPPLVVELVITAILVAAYLNAV